MLLTPHFYFPNLHVPWSFHRYPIRAFSLFRSFLLYFASDFLVHFFRLSFSAFSLSYSRVFIHGCFVLAIWSHIIGGVSHFLH